MADNMKKNAQEWSNKAQGAAKGKGKEMSGKAKDKMKDMKPKM